LSLTAGAAISIGRDLAVPDEQLKRELLIFLFEAECIKWPFCAKYLKFSLSHSEKSSYIELAQTIHCRQLTWFDGAESRFHLTGRVVSTG
jgi:hypothetical protein